MDKKSEFKKKVSEKKSMLVGKNIELLENINQEPQLIKGLKGIIFHVDSAGHILVRWENGCSLNILPDVDRGKYRITKPSPFEEKVFNFIKKSASEAFDTKTPIDELPIQMEITNGCVPGSNVSLGVSKLWCKFLNGEWFRPYGNFDKEQIYQMIDICKNDLQIEALMELLSLKKEQ